MIRVDFGVYKKKNVKSKRFGNSHLQTVQELVGKKRRSFSSSYHMGV